ncbi:hypothetical protein BX667DRAFT_518037 [Coemansia mojavensis]|nr:hypothetical protein BX667DRAFT_518037 [Coemansia mojavensis]
MAHTASSMQSPVTPSRQIGAARGPRRTPASRSKKPYARPPLSTTNNSQADYQSQASPGFLKGMRSLVARLWGTSLKSKSSAAAAPSREIPAKSGSLEMHSEKETRVEPSATTISAASSQVAARAAAAAAAAAASDNATGDTGRHAATVSEVTRARRPTAESLFAPSPYAYNKRLATASPSVASLRDSQRIKTESPALSRRHSSVRADPRISRLPSGSQLMTPRNGNTEASRVVSPSNAQRLLSTLGSIHTPILDARSRSAGGPLSASYSRLSRGSSDLQLSATERITPMPLRRLPISLLAFEDTSNSDRCSPLAEPAAPIDTSSLRRSTSLRAIPRRQATAPSLARTIQLQQARKAVAERLIRDRAASAQPANNDEAGSETDDAATSPELSAQSPEATAGNVHMREDEDDVDMDSSKRRRGSDGQAIMMAQDSDTTEEHPRSAKRKASRTTRTQNRRRRYTNRSASAIDPNIKWRFSARFDALSDDQESSSESDEDREALAAKVPLSKIRGGELIGLSLRSTASMASSSSNSAIAVRSTGFGSTRTPIPISGEEEPAASSSCAASAEPASSAAASTSTTAAANPAPVSEPASAAPGVNLTSKPVFEASEAKAEEEKSDELAAVSAPTFSFGKPASTETEKPAAAAGSAEKSATPAAPKFSFGFSKPDSEATTAPATSSAAASSTATAAPTFSFGAQSTKRSADEDDEPAKKASVPTFSFGAQPEKSSADTAAEPAKSTSVSTFSFGKAADRQP